MIKRFFLLQLCVIAVAAFGVKANPSGFSHAGPPESARVVVVRNPAATDAFQPKPEQIPAMVERGLCTLLQETNASAAWRRLLAIDDVVGIKVYSSPGAHSGTRPAVVSALVESLVSFGLPRTNIIIWDANLIDLRLAGFAELAQRLGVRLRSSAQAGYDGEVFYDSPIIGQLIWGDHEFGRTNEFAGRKSHLSTLVTRDMTKLISVTPLLNQNHTGVAGSLYSLAMGSVDNARRFEHNAQRLSVAVPEIYALPELCDRAVLHVTDALICQYEGEQRTLTHYSAMLNELRFSTDPVALDVLSLQELERQRELRKAGKRPSRLELYKNAALLELGVADPARIQVQEVVLP